MEKEQELYLEWLDDMLYQGGILTQAEIDEALENLKRLFSR